MKIHVINHHESFRYDICNSDIDSCDIAVLWNDFSFGGAIQALKDAGKKIVVFEHGRNALWDYYLNDRPLMADAYLAWGQSGKDAIEEACLAQGVSIPTYVVGNPIYDGLRQRRYKPVDYLNVLFVAMHWVRDVTPYNSKYLSILKDCLNDGDTLTVKTMEKTGIEIPEGVDVWSTELNNPESMEQVKKKIRQYDLIVTPKESTFELFARFNGIPVVEIDTGEEYRIGDDPQNYSRVWANKFKLEGLQEAIYQARENKLYMPTIEEIEYECQRPSISKERLLEIFNGILEREKSKIIEVTTNV